MPIIEIQSTKEFSKEQLESLQSTTAKEFGIDANSVWITSQTYSQNAMLTGSQSRPIVYLTCREVYPSDVVERAVARIRSEIGQFVGLPADQVYCSVRRLNDAHVFSPIKPIRQSPALEIKPVGTIQCPRVEVLDDDWGKVESTITLDPKIFTPDATMGLSDFSHVEIVFYMHMVETDKINSSARRPRNNPDWPLVGMLSQRGKNRVNRIGVTRCELVSCDGLTLRVRGLDAVNGTPVLDIKPWIQGFAPRGKTYEPAWATEIMNNYW